MNVLDSLRVGLRALAANKLRSALTMLGIIIGVAAVIALMSIGKGAQVMITSQIEGMGTNLLFIRPGAQQQGGVRAQAGSVPTLTYDDAVAIGEVVDVTGVAPETGSFAQIIAGGQNVATRIVGTTPEYPAVRNFHPAQGEFFTRQHVESRALVIVLGANVAKTLFGEGDAVDQTVSVGMGPRRVNFRVVGVMEAKGAGPMGNQDDMALMPLTTLQQRLFPQRTARGSFNVNSINVQVAEAGAMAGATQEIGALLRERHRTAEDDFTILSQQDMLQVATQITMVMTLLLGSIAGISLVVGGIGIMNIML
ncbi:MAG: ABC transporter permease, partial [Chloroflexi bacterium]|nr:ABC transporter permease [Chloroflexota bacterium]